MFGGFVALLLTLVVRPPLLATFFELAGCLWVLLRTNESKGRHRQPFYFVWYSCSKEQRLWGSPQIKIMSSYFDEKWKKNSGIKRGIRGETEENCFVMHSLCLQSKSFVDTSFFFYFGISNCFVIAKEEFQKNCFHSGIKWILWKRIQKICFFWVLFFSVFLEYWTLDLPWGHARDTWLKKFCKNYRRQMKDKR